MPCRLFDVVLIRTQDDATDGASPAGNGCDGSAQIEVKDVDTAVPTSPRRSHETDGQYLLTGELRNYCICVGVPNDAR